jgi:hypothetical protein
MRVSVRQYEKLETKFVLLEILRNTGVQVQYMRFEVLTAVKMSMFSFLAALKIDAVCSSETLISSYKPTWRYKSEDQHRQITCTEHYNCLDNYFKDSFL